MDSPADAGRNFVRQYYQVFQNDRNSTHQYYREMSTMARIDGETIDTASGLAQIRQLLISLDIIYIELTGIYSFQSWNDGLLVVVSGLMMPIGLFVWRKFVQTFFLAPQNRGYFVLNDMFHIINDDVAHQAPAPVAAQEHNVGYHLPEIPDVQYAANEEYVGGLVDEPDQDQNYPTDYIEKFDDLKLELEAITQEEEEPYEEPRPAVEEPITEPGRPPSYASMLEKSPPKGTPPKLQVVVPTPKPSTQNNESRCVHVGNVPFGVTGLELKKALERFGKVGRDGVSLRDPALEFYNVRYAFVEFEDVASAHKAIEARSIILDNRRKVYINPIRPGTYHRGEGSKGKKLIYKK